MKVSIITPTFNYGRFLTDCMQSVLNQTYTDWEMFVCDDGSTDNTQAIVKSFTDPRIRLLTGPHSGGPAIPRNRGIRAATGDYIALLDSDDMLTKDSIEKRVHVLETDPVDAVCGQTIEVDENCTLVQAYQIPYEPPDLLRNLRIPTVMLRRQVLHTCGVFDERLQRYEETEFLFRVFVARNKTYFCSPDVLAYYRVHSASITAEMGRMDNEYRQTLKQRMREVAREYKPSFYFRRRVWKHPRANNMKEEQRG